jgi:hypothetical protein
MIFEFEFSIPNSRVSNIRASNSEVPNPGGLEPIGLGFESLVSNPSVLDSRRGLEDSGPLTPWVEELLGLSKVDP